jgi:hypothetical protein
MLFKALLDLEERDQQGIIQHGSAYGLEVCGAVKRLIPPTVNQIEWILASIKRGEMYTEAIYKRT